MLLKYLGYAKYILPLMRSSLMPALFLSCALLAFFILTPIDTKTLHFLHWSFFAINILSIAILIYNNQSKPLFFILLMTLLYCLINYLKFSEGVIYNISAGYQNLIFFAATGIVFFYFQPNRPFFSKETALFLLIMSIAATLAEIMSQQQIYMLYGIIECNDCGLQPFGVIVFIITLSVLLVHASIDDKILNPAIFFATTNIAIAIYFSYSLSEFVLFFFNAALTTAYATAISIQHAKYKDVITGADNGNSFVNQAKKLPLKYGLGVICIDDYLHLQQAFKKSATNELLAMVVKKINQLEPEAMLYRYSPDEFVIIFPWAEKGSSFNNVDEIRRSIASAEFIISKRKKPLKITVSCTVTDKKRSDTDVFEVFMRARKVLQKSYKFTQNITSRA